MSTFLFFSSRRRHTRCVLVTGVQTCAAKVPLSQRAQANAAVADENRDRAALYREIAAANNHPEWEAQIRAAFAKTWIEKAHAGWYYQNAPGAWQKKKPPPRPEPPRPSRARPPPRPGPPRTPPC